MPHEPTPYLPLQTQADALRWPQMLGKAAADPMIDLWIDPARLAAFIDRELSRLTPGGQQIAHAEEKISHLINAPRKEGNP